MGESNIKQMHQKALTFKPVEGPKAKFVQFVIRPDGAWHALDENGDVWLLMKLSDGLVDVFGNEHKGWVRIDYDRFTAEASAIIDPRKLS